jgi:nicotinamide-nucleotide amidase
MKVQIITIGDELLIGQTVDTNSTWLAIELTSIGFTVSSILSINDSEQDIKQAVSNSLKNNILTIITGGLGPTKDDITKNVLCNLFNTELEFNEIVYSDVVNFLKHRSVGMNKLNKDQALFPKAAKLLRNRQGTAPGMWFEKDSSVVISLPGVPREMKGIFAQEIKQRLIFYFKLPENYYQTVMITGLAEAQLAILIEEWERALPEKIKLAYLPSPGVIRLRLGVTADDNIEKSKKVLQEQIKKLHEIIPGNIFSDYEVSLQEVVGKLLINSNKTLSIAESCTGGTIAQLITSVAGSSEYFKGSVVAYANEIKENVLGVNSGAIEKYGAVSKQVVEQMAQGAVKLLNTDYSIATSGIAGPSGGTHEKPVGTVWIAVADSKNVYSQKFIFGSNREVNIKRSSIAALNFLRKTILNNIV